MTRAGLATLLGGAALVALGAATGWTGLVALGAGGLVLVAAAVLATRRRPHLEIERHIHPSRVERGTPAIAYVHLSNAGRSTVPPSIAVQPFGSGGVRLRLPRLAGGESGVRTYALPTTRRGVFDLGPLELTLSDPFALVHSVQRHGAPERLWVYPRIHALRPLSAGVDLSLEGPVSDVAQRGTITFHEIREYQRGDDLRMIHWKSTARTGQLMVRQNVDTSQPLTVVLLDLRPVRYSAATFESAVDVAASVLTAATFGRSPVELRTSGGRRLGGREAHEPQPLIDHLAAVEPDPAGSLVDELVLLRRVRAGGASLVVVTGELEPLDLPVLATLRRQFHRLVLVAITPVERAPVSFPGVQILCATDAERLSGLWNLAASR